MFLDSEKDDRTSSYLRKNPEQNLNHKKKKQQQQQNLKSRQFDKKKLFYSWSVKRREEEKGTFIINKFH